MIRLWPLLALSALVASGHDLQVTLEQSGAVVVARAAYAGTEPCMYAAVTIFAPGESKTEFQNGRTDATGMFAFLPDRAGEWRFVIDDEMGHRKELTVAFQPGGTATLEASVQPMWQKALTGVSLIVGLTGVAYGWKVRRAR